MIIKQALVDHIKTTATLLALHGANAFQIQHYQQAALAIEKTIPEDHIYPESLLSIDISKNHRSLIEQILQHGSLQRYDELMLQTPEEIWELLKIPGLGPQKVRTLWQTLGITSLEQLTAACQTGQVATLKGFGPKTQANIVENLALLAKYQQQYHYTTAWGCATELTSALDNQFPQLTMSWVGELRRNCPIVRGSSLLIGTNDPQPIINWLNQHPSIQATPQQSGPFAWRGTFIDSHLPLQILFYPPHEFYKQLIIQTGNDHHLAWLTSESSSLGQVILQTSTLASEEAGYQAAGVPYVLPELREGVVETQWIQAGMPPLLTATDLQGILHVHTTYSDGRHTLSAMANYCKAQGYSYIGISDHSQSAGYAGGLKPASIKAQHQAIDELNGTLAPFKIFKGIEADILPDGNLDYPEEILATFDFVIASIHMGLQMNQEKATERLLKAISNPFTTILGHPTGRLLLKREGYPVDYPAIIAACAQHGVVIEFNANPWRLEIDWQWIPMAIQQGVMVSINPDAHSEAEFSHLTHGISVARKGGVQAIHTLNTYNTEMISAYFQRRKQKR